MNALTLPELQAFLPTLEADYELRVPVRLLDGTRALGRLADGPLALNGGALPRKPTELFFGQHEKLFDALPDGRYCLPAAPQKPLCVVGLTAADLDCLEFVDRFFTSGLVDDLYLAKRQGAVIIGLTGRCGAGGELLRLSGGKCDLELVADGERFIVVPYSAAGQALARRMNCAESDASLTELQQASDRLSDQSGELLDRASALLRSGQVPDAFWDEIGARCIACTGCNLVCPTCTCFGVQDWCYPDRVERSRLWDSCQLDGFMREASGHNPLGTEGLRTWRRIHHKLAADVERWGHRTCFSCGRCDLACPTGIGILAVCRELLARYDGEISADWTS